MDNRGGQSGKGCQAASSEGVARVFREKNCGVSNGTLECHDAVVPRLVCIVADAALSAKYVVVRADIPLGVLVGK